MLLRSFLFTSLCSLTFLSTSINAQKSFYPPEFIKSYVDRCTASRGLAVQAVCECIIRKIQDKYTYEEFETINNQIEATGKIPSNIVEDITTCQANPNS